jgi:AmmeMemoRadiSam system protein B
MEQVEYQVKKRSPVVSGIFYPENPKDLASKLVAWGLKEGACGAGGRVILAPHGAWELTGNIAVSAFSAVQGKKEKSGKTTRVLLLGTHHCISEEGIYLSESASFETPLGELPVDQNLNRKLASCSTIIKINDIPHLSEHSLEVLLPFVKYCFPKVKIIPILMAGGRAVLVSCLANALKIIIEKYIEESLIIISSTVSQALDPLTALSMADEFRSLLEETDAKTFLERLESGNISACGGALIGALLESGLLGDNHFSSIGPLAKSTGEKGETVYYGAFVSGRSGLSSQ